MKVDSEIHKQLLKERAERIAEMEIAENETWERTKVAVCNGTDQCRCTECRQRWQSVENQVKILTAVWDIKNETRNKL